MTELESARAIALFSPTGGGTGFLQPIFAGPAGDNKSYVQLGRGPEHVDRFHAIGWPERDCVMLQTEILVSVGGESLWAFAFDDGEVLVLPWSQFRAAMQERLETAELHASPLLSFDIVDTLDLEQLKPAAYTRAYQRYQAMGSEAAENWRSRAILEPYLVEALQKGSSRPIEDLVSEARFDLRARVVGDIIKLEMDRPEAGHAQILRDAYHALQSAMPNIFPPATDVAISRRARQPDPIQGAMAIKVVLVGRIRRRNVDYGIWRSREIDVVDIDHFHPESRKPPAALTIILGAQVDWQEMVEAGRALGSHPAILVALSSSVAPLLRDLEFQDNAQHPTITFFAPFATSAAAGGDPVRPLASILEILHREIVAHPDVLPVGAQHSVLMREPLWSEQSPVEACCRLGARALRAGAVLEGRARLYCQGAVGDELYAAWSKLLAPLFDVVEAGSAAPVSARRATILLLAERVSSNEPGWHREQLQLGAGRLLEMRGWKLIEQLDDRLTIADSQRQFAVAIVDSSTSAPPEESYGATPGLGQSRLLVIHMNPKREQLLVGNCGQFFHIALEDIAFMEPGRSWIWPILRRQLLESSGRPTLGALKLSAVLVAEAIRLNRVQLSIVNVDWEEVAAVMLAKDCERFIQFHQRGIDRKRALLTVSVSNDLHPQVKMPAIIELVIDYDGPIVSASVDMV